MGNSHRFGIFNLCQLTKDPSLLPIDTAELPPLAIRAFGNQIKGLVWCDRAYEPIRCARATTHIGLA